MHLQEFKNSVLPVKNKLYRFALRLLLDEDEAKDVVQEVLIKVWNKREVMHTYHNLEAWCMAITKNACLDKLRAKSRRVVQPIDGFMDISDKSGGPLGIVEAKDTLTRIHAFINDLPAKQRIVIQLRDIEGFSYREIAESMEIDINLVKVNLFRARKAIKEKLINADGYGL